MSRSLTLLVALSFCAMLLGCGSGFAPATLPTETFAPGHLVVVYRDSTVPATSRSIAGQAGAKSITDLPLFGLSTMQVEGDESAAIVSLLADPHVAMVLHDRIVTAHTLTLLAASAPAQAPQIGKLRASLPLGPPESPAPPESPDPPDSPAPPAAAPSSDPLYASPQGWAVLNAGGFGDGIPGGPSLGPWNTSLGAGARIAILDSGVDANHPDIAPNLTLNLSEVDPVAMPSPCDTGSPQDQQGHGTFTASLAAAAIGGGDLIGVAPQASLLNIKVIQRLPASTGGTLATQCAAGQASGLLSWVLLGLQDAVTHHANIVSLSLGTLIDTATGDGAGWQAEFNAATFAAQQAGTVVIAALGNDALDLSHGTLIELPAQARNVLPVVASTNPACAEDLSPGATCSAGPVTRASYSNHGVAGAIAAPGGSYPQGSTTNGITGFVRGACSSGLPNTADGQPSSASEPDGKSFGCFGLGHAAYVQAIGTSASAPLVAGAAAILMAAHPNWPPALVVQALRSTATPVPAMLEPAINLPSALALP